MRRRDKDHFEAYNLYFQVCYLGMLYQRYYIFLGMTLYLISQVSPKWRPRARITLRRREKVDTEAWKLYFQERYIGKLYQ